MKIDLATTFDLSRPQDWPRRHLGLYRSAAQCAQSLKAVGDVRQLEPVARKGNIFTALKWRYYDRFKGKKFYSWADPSTFKTRAKRIEAQLAQSNANFLVCPENAIALAGVKTNLPTILWTDAPIGALVDFYPYLSNICDETRLNIRSMEFDVFDQCALLIFATQWSARAAQRLYRIPKRKIRVIPRFSPPCLTEKPDREPGTCYLLWIGLDWERKGGPEALKITSKLAVMGVDIELHIVGCDPPGMPLPPYCVPHGFIDRSRPEGEKQMRQLFAGAHFLLLPTQADVSSRVLAEAAAFGLPVLCSDVGGVAENVASAVSGHTFPEMCGPNVYCSYIQSYMNDFARYKVLEASALAYASRLESTDHAIKTVFDELIDY